jgi:P-type E1-E2 ATPase
MELEHLVLDVNGTLTHRGELIPGVAERITQLREGVVVHLLSADTRGQLGAVAERLAVPARAIRRGDEKRAFVERLGADQCGAVGNGLNDAPMLGASRLGIAVVGPEGASSAAVAAADVVCATITAALDLLLDPVALASTVRP